MLNVFEWYRGEARLSRLSCITCGRTSELHSYISSRKNLAVVAGCWSSFKMISKYTLRGRETEVFKEKGGTTKRKGV